MNIDEMINGWTFKETVQTAENLMEAEKNMFTWDVIRHLRDFLELYSEQLKEYQQLEEQDRLVKLPCHIGDSIYSVVEDGLTIVELKFSLDFYARRKNDFGKTVFLTKTEAEVKLKELRGGENDG